MWLESACPIAKNVEFLIRHFNYEYVTVLKKLPKNPFVIKNSLFPTNIQNMSFSSYYDHNGHVQDDHWINVHRNGVRRLCATFKFDVYFRLCYKQNRDVMA